MKRRASRDSALSPTQRQSNELMRRMRRKAARNQNDSPRGTLVTQSSGGGSGGPRSMLQVLYDMKRAKSASLLYTTAEAGLLDTLEERQTRVYSQAEYLAVNARESLWHHQEEALEFMRAREADSASLGASGTLYCDQMGLGKTRAVLSLVLSQNQAQCRRSGRRFNGGATLIVCGTVLVDNWVKEIERFPSHAFTYRVVAEAHEIAACTEFALTECLDIVITTYTALTTSHGNARYSQLLFEIEWARVVADEAHVFVNEATDCARDMFALRGRTKIAITGTPVRNKRLDLKTLVNFIGFQDFSAGLADRIMLARTRDDVIQQQREAQRLNPRLSLHCLPELKTVTRRVQLVQFRTVPERLLYYVYAKIALQRRLGSRYNTPMLIQLMRQLCISPAVVKNLALPLGMLAPNMTTDPQPLCPADVQRVAQPNPVREYMNTLPSAFRITYRPGEAYNKSDALYGEVAGGGGVCSELVWDPFAQLSSDFALDDESTAAQYGHLYREMTSQRPDRLGVTPAMLDAPVMAGCSAQKTRAMLTHLLGRVSLMGVAPGAPSSKEQAVVDYVAQTPVDDRVVIFSIYTGILDGLERALRSQSLRCIVVTGRTNARTNAARLQQFQSDRGIKVLLMTLKLGNMGLNLTDANHVLHADPWWNPWATEQGDFRIRRPGQLKPIFIIYFIMDDTIEVAIMNHTIRKKTLLRSMLDNGDALSAEEESLLFDYKVTITPV